MIESMAPLRVLIVEDEAITAMMLKQSLIASGFEVLGVAATGEDAIIAAKKSPPDLVLMDIRLADGIDGITAAVTINNNIPIIFMTAFVDKVTITRAREIRPVAILEKPLNMTELVSLISTVGG